VRGSYAPFVAAALAGLSAHPSEGMRSPEDMAARAVALGCATAKRLEESEDVEPDSDRRPEPMRGESIELRVDDEISRVVNDLVERVGALESELGVDLPEPKGE
jgi:hypothetical protein